MRISKDEIAGEKYIQFSGKKMEDSVLKNMLQQNTIDGFLKPERLEIQEEIYYRYAVTGKESISSFHERRHMNPGEILLFLEELQERIQQGEEYLIDGNQIVMEPEGVFYSKERGVELCCFPECNRGMNRSLTNFMQFLMKWMSAGSALEMKKVYWIYEELQKENASFSDIMKRRAEIPVFYPKETIPEPVEKERKWYHFLAKNINFPIKGVAYEDVELEETEEEGTVELGTETLEKREYVHRLKRIGHEMREEIPIYRYPATVGKMEEMDIVISVPTVSGRHAQFQKLEEEIWIRDLGSLNGTYVNENRIKEAVIVKTGDRIRFADQEYFFE